MKRFRILLVAVLLFPLIINGQWTVKDPWLAGHYEINYVHAANEFNVWVCAKDQSENHHGPMFSHSDDGGESWESGYIVLQDYLAPSMIFGFEDFPYAFAAVYSTDDVSDEFHGIHATFDGGHSWQRLEGAFEDPAAWPDIIYFWSTTWGVAIGDPVDGFFDIYTTYNLGTNWQKLPQANIPDPLPGEAAIVGTFDAKGSTIWFSTTKGRVYRSEDYGINWAVFSSPFSSFSRVVFKDINNGWLQDVGNWESTQIARTNNGGEDWELMNHTGPLLNWDIDYIPGTISTLISSGAYINNGISTSNNNGNDWYWLEEPGTKYFKMDWFDWQHGWVGGYDEIQQRPIIYQYSGPGVGEYIVSPLDIYFGYVPIGTSLVRNITVTNLSTNPLELTDIFTNIGIFSVTPSSGWVDPNGGQLNIEVTFTPEFEGVYEDWVTIASTHPEIPEVTVHLMGDGFYSSSNIIIDPLSLNENLYTGQTITKTLTVTNVTDEDINYQASVDCGLPLGALGWNYASTPLGCDDGILCGEADQAMFIKEFSLEEFNFANLFLGYDDGIRCWVNGTLVFDDLHGGDGLSYWDQEIDITSYLHSGKNRVSAVVFNGIYSGCCEGEFDCQLTVDGVDVIKRGDENYGTPEATWFYFGESGQQLVPGMDVNGKNWWEDTYGKFDWVTFTSQSSNGFTDLGWTYRSAPFNGEDVLSSSPDNAQFVKDIEVGEFSWATLYLGFDDGCKVWINGTEVFDYQYEVHGLNYWDHEDDVTPYLQPGHNRISIEVYNGIYGGGAWGGFDCQLIVDDVEVIKRGSDYSGMPEAMWWVYGQGNQVLTPPLDASSNNWYDMNYCSGSYFGSNYLTDLNWSFGSAPFPGEHGILESAPDNAQFIRDIEITEFSWATLFLGYDDGCRIWINGNLAFDFHTEDHAMEYWNRDLDISSFLIPGRNRIAVEVYNGIYGGGGGGGFDCQLIVDDVAVIKRGDENPGQLEAMWYYFGQTGQILTPPVDLAGLQWFEMNYGISNGFSPAASAVSGSIAAGESATIEVMINASGLSTGEYQTNILFTSEVSEYEVDVPVSLYVTSEGVLSVTPGELDFGDFYIGYPETIALTLKNTGFQTLNIINIWSDLPDIYPGFTEAIIEPGASVVLDVTLDSYTVGLFISTLNIQTTSYSSITSEVQIKGFVKEAPQLVIENVDYMYSYLASGQSENQSLHISNWGGSSLTFTLPQGSDKMPVTRDDQPQLQTWFKPETKLSSEVVREKQPEYYNSDIIQTIKPAKGDNQDLQPKAGMTMVEIYSDDMENGTNEWTIENYGEGSSKWHQVDFNYYSSETSWWCGDELTGTYFDGYTVRQAIVSPSIKLPDLECTITLNFIEWYSIEEGYDQCFIDVSTNGGYNWIRVRDYNPGSSYGWINTTIDLSMFYGSEIKVRFFFDTGDEIANEFPGWFVDDVMIFFHVWDFLQISPSGGTVYPNEGADINVTFNAVDYSEGLYLSMLLFRTNDPEHEWFYLPAYMDVWGGGLTQQVFLQSGWSGISSYLAPDNPTLDPLFSQVSNDLVILQNLEGVYWPSEGINTIGDWNYLNGYAVKMTNSNSLTIQGTLPENRLIEMPGNWSLIPVLSMNPVAATDFDILESLNMIKDVAGTGIYWPVYNINTLQELQPGKSYLINTSGFETFEYQPMTKSQILKNTTQPESLISPWNEVSRTPFTHLIAVPAECLTGFAAGDIIGIFTQEGYCAGFAIVQNPGQNIPVTVFGDDPTTANKDGLAEGETMVVRLMKAVNSETTDLEVTFSNAQPNQGSFVANGVSAISGIKLGALTSAPLSLNEVSIQPNPATDWLRITSNIPVSKIEISDAKGITILSSNISLQTDADMDISCLPVGFYFVKISTTDKTEVRKIIIR